MCNQFEVQVHDRFYTKREIENMSYGEAKMLIAFFDGKDLDKICRWWNNANDDSIYTLEYYIREDILRINKMKFTNKQKELLGIETTHVDDINEFYNEPSITDVGVGIAPKVRLGISAYCIINDDLYYMGEDDCHYWIESKVYSIEMLEDTLKNLKEYRNKDNYLELGYFFDNNQIMVQKREDSNSILSVAMFNSVRRYDASWINEEIELIEKVINILNEK